MHCYGGFRAICLGPVDSADTLEVGSGIGFEYMLSYLRAVTILEPPPDVLVLSI